MSTAPVSPYGVHLAVVARMGEIDDELSASIAELGKHFAFPISPEVMVCEHVLSPSRRIGLFAWRTTHPSSSKRCTFLANRQFAAAIDGWATLPTNQTNEAFFERLDGPSAPSIVSRLGGVFSLYRADLGENRIDVWNSVMGSRAVVYSETPEFVAIGNRPALTHLAARRLRDYAFDARATVSLLVADTVFPGDTVFRDTRVLPQNSHISASPSAVRITPVDDAVEMFGRHTGTPTVALWDDLAHALLENVSRLGKDTTTYGLGLSGGRDSRLVAAALKVSNVDFIAGTSGFDDYADVIVAKQIAACLDVPLSYDRRFGDGSASGPVESYSGTMSYLRETEGMSMTRVILPASYEKVGTPRRADGVWIDGVGGEVMRGGSYLVPSRTYMRGRTSLTDAEVWEILKEARGSSVEKWLKPEFQGVHANRFDDWARRVIDPKQPTNVLERLYFEFAFQVKYGFHRWLMPLSDNRIIRLTQQVEPRARILERPHFEMIRRIFPALLDIPLENSRWAFEAGGPLPGDEQGWRFREPVVDKASMASNYAYFMAGRELRDELYEVIFKSKGTNLLGEIVDLDEVARSFKNRDLYDWRYGWSIWNLYSAAIMFSGVVFPESFAGVEHPKHRLAVVVDTGAPWHMMTIGVLDASKTIFLGEADRGKPDHVFNTVLTRFAKRLEGVRTAHNVAEATWSEFLAPIVLDEFVANGTTIRNVSDLWQLHSTKYITADISGGDADSRRRAIAEAIRKHFRVEGEMPSDDTRTAEPLRNMPTPARAWVELPRACLFKAREEFGRLGQQQPTSSRPWRYLLTGVRLARWLSQGIGRRAERWWQGWRGDRVPDTRR